MEKIDIKVKVAEGASLPIYKTVGASGADICAFLQHPLLLAKDKIALVPTGLFFEIPLGYEIQVRPRSGLAAKNGVTVLNTPGTIDSDYRGEVKVILVNHGNEDFIINNGDRIAQIVVAPLVQGNFLHATSLCNTDRGVGGFGSTGVC